MLELKIKAGRRNIPIFDLPAALGRAEAYREIGDQIDALIAFMDDLQGDVDLEDGNDDEPDGDAMGDQSWPEDPRARSAMLGSSISYQEGDEDDDPLEDDDSDRDASGDDWMAAGNLNCGGMMIPGEDEMVGASEDDEEDRSTPTPEFNA